MAVDFAPSRLPLWLRVAIPLVLIALILAVLAPLVERKSSYKAWADFYAQEADFDVLIAGNSHTLNGFFPMDLWREYGIVAYDIGGHSNTIAVSYWAVANALQYTHPRVVVLDLSYLTKVSRVDEEATHNLHRTFDYMPLTPLKVQAIWDLVGDLGEAPRFIWNFSLYHNRWSSLGIEDFRPKATPTKGADFRVGILPVSWSKIDPSLPMKSRTIACEYLERIVTLCRDQGVDLVFVYVPSQLREDRMREINGAREISAELGVDFVNYFDLDLVNLQTGFYDSSHLNVSGARDVTSYLGQYLREQYDIPDRRQDPAYAGLAQDYEEYLAYEVSLIRVSKDLHTFLLLLRTRDIAFTLAINPEAIDALDDLSWELLSDLGVSRQAVEACEATGALVSVSDGIDGGVSIEPLPSPGEPDDMTGASDGPRLQATVSDSRTRKELLTSSFLVDPAADGNGSVEKSS